MSSPWSFSSIKLFEQCPRKYYHLRVAKDFAEPTSDAMLYGTRFHEAAEFYIKEDRPLPEAFNFAKGALDSLRKIPGDKYCEYEMGLTENLDPCGFRDPQVWFRGIADLLIIDNARAEARVLDYKTGKSAKYADTGQLELMALAVFKHFPEVKRVKAGLLFVIANAFPKANYSIDQAPILWQKWLRDHDRMKGAYRTNTWNPRPSGLCRKHCVVTTCPHNGRNG
jgi:hypothetical protein